MGWDVVEIGLKHNLPINDPFATAQEIAKRMKQNVRLVDRGLTELGMFEVEDSKDYLQMMVCDKSFELYEIEGGKDDIDIRIFKETVNLDVYVYERWHWWESAFWNPLTYRERLHNYRMQIYHQAKLFGCQEVIICSDQGPTMEIYDRANYSSDDLKEYAQSFQYLKDDTWLEEWEKEGWKKDAKHIMFSDYFQNNLKFASGESIDVIFDDFSDIETN